MQLFNPFDPAFDEDPFPALAEMRRQCPVAEVPPGLHVITTYELCTHALREWHSFSSAGGGTMATDLPPETITINATDGQYHVRLRRMLQSVLRPTNYKAESDWIAARAAELVDELLPGGRADLMRDLAYRLPARVILKLVGVSDEDYATVRGWTEQIEDSAEPTKGIFMGDFYSGRIPHPAVDDFNGYLQRLIDERRGGLEADDLVARVVAFRDEDGRGFTDGEIRTQMAFLLIAGNHTTGNLIGSLLAQLVQDPQLYARVRKERSLVEPAVEETLRIQSPVQGIFRTIADDVEVEGTKLTPGQKVLVHLQSANRDDEVFDHPDTFDIDRPNLDRHVAFGYGVHFCIGAPLARLETTHALNALLDRIERIELEPGAEARIWTRSVVNRGPRSLPVRFTAA
jgi:cytochrome P450